MERVYNELEENLQVVFNDFTETDYSESDEITITVENEVNDKLVYGLSFVRIHDANYLIGSCYGGGYEFIEWIDENTITVQPVTDNFKKLGLKVLSVDSEL